MPPIQLDLADLPELDPARALFACLDGNAGFGSDDRGVGVLIYLYNNGGGD